VRHFEIRVLFRSELSISGPIGDEERHVQARQPVQALAVEFVNPRELAAAINRHRRVARR
jgi:hypothetical protein